MAAAQILSILRARIGVLVHPAVEDEAARLRHVDFMLTRLVAGLAALALVPVYLVVWGAPGALAALALSSLALPVVAAAVLSRTGRLLPAHAISSLALAGLILTVSRGTGGMASPALIFLPLMPLGALAWGERGAALAAAAIAAATAGVVLAAESLAGPAATVLSSLVGWPLAAAVAIAYTTALVLLAQRRDREGRRREVARHVRDRAVLGALNDLVTWHDAAGQVVFASEAARSLLGEAPEGLGGRGLFERVHVADRPAFLKALADARHTARPVEVRYRLLTPSPEGRGAPTVRWVEMRAAPADAQAPDGCAVIAVTRDVSDQRQRELELEEARRAAVSASEAKDRFLAVVSHELRTPLNAIIGFSEMLASDSLCPADEARRREYAGIIAGSGRHLLDVVNSLLDVSRIESGNFTIAPEPFDLAALARDCCDLMEVKARAAGVCIRREIGTDACMIVADPRACRQILLNLLANALKFTPQGEVAVRLAHRGAHVALVVSDTGIGIAESDLPQLGKPFFQAHSSYDRPHEGAGLGFSVVQGLAALHGGSVEVASRSGEGTTVTVSLPRDGHCARPTPAAAVETIARPRGTVHPFKEEMKKSA